MSLTLAMAIFGKLFVYGACIWAVIVVVAVAFVAGRIAARIAARTEDRRNKAQHDDNENPTESR
jgi:hypothetical protein